MYHHAFANIYKTIVAACGRSGEWSHALQLFVNMKADQIRCDVVAYNALMSAFANGGKPDMVSNQHYFSSYKLHSIEYMKSHQFNLPVPSTVE